MLSNARENTPATPDELHFSECLQALIEVIDSRPQIVLLAAASNATIGREQRYLRPRIDNLPSFLAITKISFEIIVCTVGVLQRLIVNLQQ